MIEVVLEEMTKGNFSFLILVVGVVQLWVMLINLKETKRGKKRVQNI